MATAVLRRHGFVAGTSVSAWPSQNSVSGGPPSGTAAATATVAGDETLTFTGLAEGTKYIAYAAGRGVLFYVDPAIAAKPAGDRERLDDLAAVIEAAGGASQIAADHARLDRLPINVMDSLFPYVDVIRDGRDNSAALQVRHDLAESTNRAVYYPSGADYNAANLQLGDNATVFGDGFGTKVVLVANAPVATNASGASLPYSHRQIFVNKHGNSTGNQGITIRDMVLDGNVSNGNAATEFYFGIAMWGVKHLTIKDVWCRNWRSEGIIVGNAPPSGPTSEDAKIENITLENCGVDAGAGNARQGIAIIQCDRFTIKTVHATTIGSFVIDIEPDDVSQSVTDYSIEGIHAYGAVNGLVSISHQTGARVKRGVVRDLTHRYSGFSPSYFVAVSNVEGLLVDGLLTDGPPGNSDKAYVYQSGTIINLRVRNTPGEVCLATRSADQTGILTTIPTLVEWNSSRYDPDAMQDLTSLATRQYVTIVVPGTYQAVVNVRWSSTAGTYRQCQIQRFSSGDVLQETIGVDRRQAAQAFQSYAFRAFRAVAGERIKVIVEHDVGASASLVVDPDYAPEFSLVKVA